MTTTLLNPNVTGEGVSADNELAYARQTGTKLALVRDTPRLVSLCKAVGMTVCYRASANDGSIDQDPVQFVDDRINAAPDADYIHLCNEVGFPSGLSDWTEKAAKEAEKRGKRVVTFNAATNSAVANWQALAAQVQDLSRRGHKIGLHLYLDGVLDHDAGGYAPLDFLYGLGASIWLTEYAYIASIFNRDLGWRAVMDADHYNTWFDQHAGKLAAYGYPAFIFSQTAWPLGKTAAQGFGYDDQPTIATHLAALNVKYPLQEGTVTPTPIPAPTQVLGLYTLTHVPLSYVNVRSQPGGDGLTGTLHDGDQVTLYAPDVHGWVYLAHGDVRGWVSRQGGAVSFTPVNPTPAFLNGMDVSENQGIIDWQAVKASGVQFAMIRACDGTVLDSAFTANIDGALSAGLKVGAYAAVAPLTPPAAHVTTLVNRIAPYKARLAFPPALDAEIQPGGMSFYALAEHLYNVASLFEQAWGAKPMLYSNLSYFTSLNQFGNGGHVAYLHSLPLWVAAWTSASAPTQPLGYQAWSLWQWSDAGKLPNGTRVDLDRAKI